MASTTAPRPVRQLLIAEVDDIKRRGGQITRNAAGELVVTYPRWAVDARTLEVLDELRF